jgi:cytoskeletal protein RodZ
MATLISDSASSERAARLTIHANQDENIAFGQLLKRAREQRGRSLPEIAAETKISIRHLEALERGEVPEASERFYRRADIRTYARAVHCDERLAVASFDRAVQASAPAQPAPAAVAQRDRSSATPAR